MIVYLIIHFILIFINIRTVRQFNLFKKGIDLNKEYSYFSNVILAPFITVIIIITLLTNKKTQPKIIHNFLNPQEKEITKNKKKLNNLKVKQEKLEKELNQYKTFFEEENDINTKKIYFSKIEELTTNIADLEITIKQYDKDNNE